MSDTTPETRNNHTPTGSFAVGNLGGTGAVRFEGLNEWEKDLARKAARREYCRNYQARKRAKIQTEFLCPICKKATNEPVVDHDHISGGFRGFLCRECNLLLGYARDDSDILHAAADYLDEEMEYEWSLVPDKVKQRAREEYGAVFGNAGSGYSPAELGKTRAGAMTSGESEQSALIPPEIPEVPIRTVR